MNIDLVSDNHTIILFVGKRLTCKTSDNINKYLFPILLKYDIKKVMVDLSKMKEINSVGFNILIKLNWMMKVKKGKVYLLEVPECFCEDFKKFNFKVLNNRKEVSL